MNDVEYKEDEETTKFLPKWTWLSLFEPLGWLSGALSLMDLLVVYASLEVHDEINVYLGYYIGTIDFLIDKTFGTYNLDPEWFKIETFEKHLVVLFTIFMSADLRAQKKYDPKDYGAFSELFALIIVYVIATAIVFFIPYLGALFLIWGLHFYITYTFGGQGNRSFEGFYGPIEIRTEMYRVILTLLFLLFINWLLLHAKGPSNLIP